MAAVDIGRLRLRGPPHLAARTAFMIEDACRTAIPDSDRLILVRRLDLGRGRDRRSGQAAALRRAYEAATLGARHGGDESSAGANCVWFASRAEARRLLLAALLAGRRPQAWYWRLAVPDWQGQPLEQWLEEQVAAALVDQGEADLLDIATLIVEAGAVETLLRIAAGPAGAAGAPVRGNEAGRAAGAEARAPAGGLGAESPNAGELRGAVLRIRERLPPGFAERVETLVRRIGSRTGAAAKLLERLLVRASPSLAMSPALLRALAEAYADHIAAPAPGRRRSDDVAPSVRRLKPTGPPPAPPPVPVRGQTRPIAGPLAAAPAARGGSADPATAAAAPPEAPAIKRPSTYLLDEIRSPAAGLWLVLPSLIRMGLREWLAERPDLLCGDPGRTLVRAIARHHRVAPEDAALLPLPADGESAPEWALLWRFGLDRWLRRRARIPLARLVWRPGWIRLSDERLVVRFAPGDADLRLRRRALDVDPGWIDWLGLSVRYAFAERPLP